MFLCYASENSRQETTVAECTFLTIGYMYVYFIFINLILSIYEYGSLTICERPSVCFSEVQYKYFHCGSCSIGVVGRLVHTTSPVTIP